MTKRVTKAELTRIRNRNVRRLKKQGKNEGYIRSYLKGWSIVDSQRKDS